MESEQNKNESISPELQAKIIAWQRDREHLTPDQREQLANEIIIALNQYCLSLNVDLIFIRGEIKDLETEIFGLKSKLETQLIINKTNYRK